MADVSGILAAGDPNKITSPFQYVDGALGAFNKYLSGQQTIQSTENLKTQNQQGQQNLQIQAANRGAQVSFGLATLPDDQLTGQAGYDKLKGALDAELQNGTITPQTHAVMIGNLPPPIGANGSPTSASTYKSTILQHLVGSLAGPEGLKAVLGGQQTSTNPDGTTSTVNVPGIAAPPTAGVNPVPGRYGGGLTPGEGSGMVNVPNADGTTTPLSTRDWNTWNTMGAPRDAGGRPVVTNSGGGGGVQVPPPAGGGTPAPVQTAPNAKPGLPTGLPGSAPIPGVTPYSNTPPADGQKQVISSPTPNSLAVAQTQTQKQQEDVTKLSSPTWQTSQQALNSVINLSPTSLSGKGTDWLGNAKAVVTNLAPGVAATLGINQNNVNDRAELAKSMNRIALSNGNRSDAELFQQMESNPNMQMPPGAVQNVARTIIGLNNQERALTLEAAGRAQNLPQNTQTHYGAVKTQLAQQTDLNGFMPMTDDQFRKYVSTLPPANTREGQEARMKLRNAQKLQEKYSNPNTGTVPTGLPTGQTP